MAVINTTNIQSILASMTKNWNEARLEGQLKTDSLFRVGTFYPWVGMRVFVGCVQPFLGIFYLIFSMIILYIFVKEKMTGFVHCLLILSNVLTNLPNVVLAPINFVFFNFSNIDAPTPYPWCAVFAAVEDHIRPMLHATSIHLKILLAVNRLCSVYYPFQTLIWFTKKRSFVYSVLTCVISLSVGALLNFTYQRLSVVPFVDDIWGNRNVQGYDCCFYSKLYNEHVLDLDLLLPLIFSLVVILGVLILVVCDILLIVKISMVKSARKKLTESRSPQMNSVEKRMDLLSAVSTWIISAVVVTEIPGLIAQIIGLEHTVRFLVSGADSIDAFGPLYRFAWMVHLIGNKALSPLDLVIFVAMSEKTRKAIKTRLCRCK